MTISGFSYDSVANNVGTITTRVVTSSGATAVDEGIVIGTPDGQLVGAMTLSRCVIFVTPRPGNTLSGGTSLGGFVANGDIREANLIDSKVCMNSPGSGVRTNLLFDNINDSSISVELPGNCFVYTDGDLINAAFYGVFVHEVNTPWTIFSNVVYENTALGMLNWEAGRLDRFGIDIASTTTGYSSWLGAGASGNAFWDWNPRVFSATDVLHQTDTSRNYVGYTASWIFRNTDGSPASGVLARYSDDRSGAIALVGQYVTGADGILEGTVNSQTSAVSSSQDYPTLYVLTSRSIVESGFFSTGLSAPSFAHFYTMAAVSFVVEFRSYLHNAIANLTSISAQIGLLNPNQSVANSSPFFLLFDPGVTVTDTSVVAAYSGISNAAGSFTLSGSLTISQVYDSRKLYWRNNNNSELPTPSGNVATFGAANITIAAPSSSPPSTPKYARYVTNGDLTLSAPGTYSLANIPATGTVVLGSSGDYNLSDFVFAVGAIVDNSSASDSFVQVSADQFSNIAIASPTAGGGSITLQAPQTTITLEGIPSGAEVRILQGSQTIDYESNILDGNYSYSYLYVAGERVKFAITSPGFVSQFFEFELAASNQSLPLTFAPDPSYIP